MIQISDDALEQKVAELLEVFYNKRVKKLQDLELKKVLKSKNPYLYRATSTSDASEIVKGLLDAMISSSDETIFGNDFFEPLAVWIAQEAHRDDPTVNADYASGSGADLQIVTDRVYSYYAIKSGTSVFNGSSKHRQLQEFQQARARLFKTQKQFDPVIAFGYGRKTSRVNSHREIAGQAFWAEISGDPQMYTRIVTAMGEGSAQRATFFREEYDKAVNRFNRELLANFAGDDGALDWISLIEYNSSIERPKWIWKTE